MQNRGPGAVRTECEATVCQGHLLTGGASRPNRDFRVIDSALLPASRLKKSDLV